MGGKARYYGEISNTPEAIRKLVKKLSPDGEVVSYCYEAGPCGYGIYRQITQLGRKRPGNYRITPPLSDHPFLNFAVAAY